MFGSTDKRLTLLENHMIQHTKREEEEMHLTNKKLEEISDTLQSLSESLIHQSSRIEITARDVKDEIGQKYVSIETFNAGLKAIRDQAKIIWTVVAVVGVIVAKMIDILLEVYPMTH